MAFTVDQVRDLLDSFGVSEIEEDPGFASDEPLPYNCSTTVPWLAVNSNIDAAPPTLPFTEPVGATVVLLLWYCYCGTARE